MRGRRDSGEEGMALLTVLLLVAVMGALTAAMLETMSRSIRMTGNSRDVMQARYALLGAETMALQRVVAAVDRSGDTLTLAGGWNGRVMSFPAGDAGDVAARISDGGNCFNLNSVADGGSAVALRARPRGILQFITLMTSLGVAEAEARRAAFSLADWIDAGGAPLPSGGEDEAYADAGVPYRTANTLVAEASELRAVAGITPEIYDVVRPWVCALPTTDLSPININTLAPSQAPLLAMVLPDRLTVDAARQVLAGRPAGGWDKLGDFWRHDMLKPLSAVTEELEQPQLTTRYFNLEIDLAGPDGHGVTQTALLDVSRGRGVVAQRRWTADE